MRRFKWLGLGLVVGVLALGVSVKTYIASLNRQEVMISEVNAPSIPSATCINAPTLTSPANGAIIYGNSVTLTWSAGSSNCPGVDVYDVVNIWFPNGTKAMEAAASGSYFWRGNPPPAPFGLYRWNVTTYNVYGQTAPSASWRFTLASTPSPSPSPSGSPSPSPSTLPASKATFVIHKFLDVNKNSVRETGEGTTNRTWEFEYQIDGGEKESYMIEPGEEEGEKIAVDKGAKVKVSELGQEGWLNTTGAELTKTLSDPKLYTFYFGNWPVSGVPPAGGFPPRQPDTGTPTWITVGAAAMGAILLTAKLLLRL